MNALIKLEEAAIMLICFFFMYTLNVDLKWWLYILLFFSPDIGMIGYLINPKIGAITYNLTHHKAMGILLIGIGFWQNNPNLTLAGLFILSHSAFDRVMGYGLKYPDNFKHTSLGYL